MLLVRTQLRQSHGGLKVSVQVGTPPEGSQIGVAILVRAFLKTPLLSWTNGLTWQQQETGLSLEEPLLVRLMLRA